MIPDEIEQVKLSMYYIWGSASFLSTFQTEALLVQKGWEAKTRALFCKKLSLNMRKSDLFIEHKQNISYRGVLIIFAIVLFE